MKLAEKNKFGNNREDLKKNIRIKRKQLNLDDSESNSDSSYNNNNANTNKNKAEGKKMKNLFDILKNNNLKSFKISTN